MKNIGLHLCWLTLFCILSKITVAQTPSASIATWRDNAQAAYTIIHDDYSSSVTGIFRHAYPNATQRGIKLCFGAITSACGPTEWANARTMITQGGHECVNHSHSHHCVVCSNANTCTTNFGCGGLTTYSIPQFETELQQSDNLIFTNTGIKPRFFIHPYDNYTTEEQAYLRTLGYLGTRAGNQLTVNSATFNEPMYMNYYVYGPGNQTTLAQLNAAVNAGISAGGYVIREFHGINDGSWGQIPLGTYISHLNFVKTKMNSKLIWSATATEAITYKMQREVYQPVPTYNAQTGILNVGFTENLANLKGVPPSLFTPSVFTSPITLNINITGIIGTLPAMALQNGTPIAYTKNGNILTMNVYPHNGAVSLNITPADPCLTDAVKPVFTNCPTNITLTATGTTAIATWTAPTATDDCTNPPSVLSTHNSGSAFPLGVTTVTYTATDAKNNFATCVFTVTVSQTDPCLTDAVKPVFTNCPTNITLTATGTTAIATWTAPTATDDCTTPPSVSSTHNSGSAFPIGITTVTYTATDAKNNVATCVFTITVSQTDPCLTDAVKPVFTNCPTNITLTATGTTAIATWTAPTATDDCTNPPSVSSSHNSNSAFPIGVTTVTYTATDAKNNVATCIFTITVSQTDPCLTDAVKPVFTNCPANITLTATGTTAIATWTTPTATDNCTNPPSVTSSHSSNSAFPIGVTTVTYTATDAKNNVATCVFTVTVQAGGGGGQDLGLTISTSATTYSKFATLTFTITLTNTGTAAFTNVNIKFPFPTGTTTGGTTTTTLGSWREWQSGVRTFDWQIPSIPAGGTATLKVPLFFQSTIPNSTAFITTLTASTPVDANAANNVASITLSLLGAPPALLRSDLLDIEASIDLRAVQVAWVSNTGETTDYFTVQKLDTLKGIFYDLEKVNNKNSLEKLQRYSVYDEKPNEGDNFYRIKQVFLDGKIVFSDVKKVLFGGFHFFNVYPNPTDAEMTLDLKNYQGKNVAVYLYNTYGQTVLTRHLEKVGEAPINFDMSKLNEGQYLIRVVSKGKRDAVKMVSIIR